MNSLFNAGLEVKEVFEKKKWPYCFIGGIAVLRWGEIRMTQYIDLSLLCEFGNEKKYAEVLLENFKSRITDSEKFAAENRVVLLYSSKNVSIDICLAGLTFESEMVKRATEFSFLPDCDLKTCSAEDLIVLKSFANRTKDWLDVEGIIFKQGSSLDTDYIFKQLKPLCEAKESPDILTKLQSLIK